MRRHGLAAYLVAGPALQTKLFTGPARTRGACVPGGGRGGVHRGRLDPLRADGPDQRRHAAPAVVDPPARWDRPDRRSLRHRPGLGVAPGRGDDRAAAPHGRLPGLRLRDPAGARAARRCATARPGLGRRHRHRHCHRGVRGRCRRLHPLPPCRCRHRVQPRPRLVDRRTRRPRRKQPWCHARQTGPVRGRAGRLPAGDHRLRRRPRPRPARTRRRGAVQHGCRAR